MNRTLRLAYQECAALTRREAQNFYYAFLLMPAHRRRAIYAIYSYCRIVDDAADLAPSAEAGRRALETIRQDLAACLSGHPRGAVFTALADVCSTFHLRSDLLYAVLDGVEQDLTVTRYATFAELRDYCWKVASAVGLLTLEIFGYRDPAAIQRAEDLGLAMQLTNILRDIREDLERGRIYLPQDEMAAFGVTEESLANGRLDESFREFMQFQIGRARGFFASGARLRPLVYWRSQPCPLVLQAVYTQVLQKIEEADYDVFSSRRGPSKSEKIHIMLHSWWQWLLTLPQHE